MGALENSIADDAAVNVCSAEARLMFPVIGRKPAGRGVARCLKSRPLYKRFAKIRIWCYL
jgi:hypothetical protein